MQQVTMMTPTSPHFAHSSIASKRFSSASSTSGSELSYASDTETEGGMTDCLTTPPTSPHRPHHPQASSSISSPSIPSASRSHSRQLSESDGQLLDTLAQASSNSLDGHLAAMKLATDESIQLPPGMSTVTPGSGTSPMAASVSTPTKTPSIHPPLNLPISGTKARAPVVQSLSAKRARRVPGVIDLSSLPQFPHQPHLLLSTSSHLSLTPQDSENSGSTPRATADQPGLFSRWSTDSEDSDRENYDDGDDSDDSSCTSSDCDEYVHDSGHAESSSTSGSADDVEEEQSQAGSGHQTNGGKADRSTRSKTRKGSTTRRSRSRSRSHSGSHHDPFSVHIADITDPISSPLPAMSPHSLASLLPPAPKPHQQGFSPYTEDQYFSFDHSSPRLDPTTREAVQSSIGTRRRQRRSSSSRRREDGANSDDQSDSGGESDSEHLFAAPSRRLTRSQGLRIRDQAADGPKGRYARALSQQLKHSNSSPSSPMKTANALLDGTISPAESTTDPLRVRLRELPGARTPDGSGSAPPSPSPQPQQAQARRSSHVHLQVSQTRNSPRLRASSPLHLSSLPGENDSSSPSRTTTDTKSNIFNSAFSFANRESPSISPLALRSPRTQMAPIKETAETDSNPYFAGYA